jgi:hypothetical protein
MGTYGFSYVSETGYVSFVAELSQGSWAQVQGAGPPVIRRRKKGKIQLTAEASSPLRLAREVAWKLRLSGGLHELVAALGTASADRLVQLSHEWDAVQRQLYHHIAGALDASDPHLKAAAARLEDHLLEGAGTAQIRLSYDDKVDTGRQQLLLTSAGTELHADVVAVGVGRLLEQVSTTTEALARGLGRGPGHATALPRNVRIRQAVARCVVDFNAVTDDLDWHLELTPAGPDHDFLAGLHQPLVDLLARFPPPSRAAAPASTVPPGGTPPAAPAGA